MGIGDKWVEVKRCELRAKAQAPRGPVPADFGIPLHPNSPGAQALKLCTREQVAHLVGVVELLKDPICCSVVQALIDQLNPSAFAGEAAYSKGKGGKRFSPY